MRRNRDEFALSLRASATAIPSGFQLGSSPLPTLACIDLSCRHGPGTVGGAFTLGSMSSVPSGRVAAANFASTSFGSSRPAVLPVRARVCPR